ncbi:MAG TPA: hypothetical protein VGG34_05075 [Opitutaceae bacterium]|jgi:hypothetical protein
MRLKARRVLAFTLVLACMGFLQVWMRQAPLPALIHGQSSGDLTDSYTAALAHGKSYFNDPRAGRLHDVSFFKGRDYVYYGLAPFIFPLVPWHALTHTFLSSEACILAALWVGYAAYGAGLLILFRGDNRPIVDLLLPAAFLALILASGTWPLTDYARINELESAFGYASLAGALAALAAAHSLAGRRKVMLAAASFCAGVAVACRPNCLPAAAVVGIAVVLSAARPEGTIGKRLGAAAACGAPLALVLLGLGAWNLARFGSALEFGMRYGTGVTSRAANGALSVSNLAYNLDCYVFGGVRWGAYFPFIEGMKEGLIALPKGAHEPMDRVYGALTLFPVLVWAAGVLRTRRGLGWVLLLSGLGNLLFLSLLGFGSYRYLCDFLGPLAFAAGIGIVGMADVPGRLLRRAAVAALVPVLLWSTAMGACELASISRSNHPKGFESTRLSRAMEPPFDNAAYALEWVLRTGPRALRIRLVLPTGRFGKSEPLMVCGDPGLEDFLYLYYTAPGLMQVGFESMGHGGPVSAPFPVDYGRPHVVDIVLGSFLPPDGHPWLGGVDKAELRKERGAVRVEVDGRVVLDGLAQPHPVEARMFVGESPDDAAFGRRFTGTLLQVDWPLLGGPGLPPLAERDQPQADSGGAR